MTTDLSFQIPARFAGEPSDGTTVEPGTLETCIRKMPTKTAKLIRTRAQRIPFRPGDRYSNKGRIHSRRPILSSSPFCLQYGGGPYIPYCRLPCQRMRHLPLLRMRKQVIIDPAAEDRR